MSPLSPYAFQAMSWATAARPAMADTRTAESVMVMGPSPPDEVSPPLADDPAGRGSPDTERPGGSEPVESVRSDGSRHVGDAILSVIEGLHRDLSQAWHAVRTAQPGSPQSVDLKPSELLAMQRDLAIFSFNSEVAGKGTSKFIDNINQTVKMS